MQGPDPILGLIGSPADGLVSTSGFEPLAKGAGSPATAASTTASTHRSTITAPPQKGFTHVYS